MIRSSSISHMSVLHLNIKVLPVNKIGREISKVKSTQMHVNSSSNLLNVTRPSQQLFAHHECEQHALVQGKH